MTVSYNLDVSSVSSFSFFKLLFRWKGSIWKSVKSELIMWIISYYCIFVIYRFALDADSKVFFAKFVHHIDQKLDYIPLTFMLGFFVSIIVDRWRKIFSNMGWIENVALTLATMMRGDDKVTVLKRRTIIRYLVLTQILVFRDMSMQVRRRFPNMESLVTAENLDSRYNRYWAPINWSISIVMEAFKNKKIEAAPFVVNLVVEIRSFRTNLAMLCNYDWVPIPIAYPQVVFLAVRVYFVVCLFARQYVVDAGSLNSDLDLYVPFMTILQFIFFVGWMKVAEALLNPMGEDDDDFECNFLIDKNISTGLAIVDQTWDYCPESLPDKFMENGFTPIYSDESIQHGVSPGLVGSLEGVTLAEPTEDVKMFSVTPKVSMSGLSVQPDTHRKFSERVRNRFFPFGRQERSRSHDWAGHGEFGTGLPVHFGDTKPPAKPSTASTISVPRSPGIVLTIVNEESDSSGKNSLKGD